ncbi:ABC-type multidrug transport system fused ATPase/permease subunit [Agromyces flavus]|uniref:ABC-type multidrug transport system fused ATPase/permease subunit n=1 Tax=Agromyces flavus TaxID=589382 RepID=A0ABT1KJ90_9MICO|nr:ABC transporter ATP-binding protein [Agromyces flavus]MCP2366955.1 ABC-type multidrug transport system fused ATPase/permease subunit [Agromyces flavus]
MSLVLAGLDTLGVAAMVPLTQLIGGAETDSGVLAVISDVIGTSDPTVLIPVVASAIAVLFVVKSLASIGFRWQLLGRTTRVSADAASALLRGYVLAPYAAHRARPLREVYRNVNDSVSQGTSVLLAVVSICTDLAVLVAITIVLAITDPVVTVVTVLVFGVFVVGLQRLLRRTQTRLGEESAEVGLEAWQYLLPSLDGFREARLSSRGEDFVRGYRKARLRGARLGRDMGIIADIPRYSLEIGFVLAVAAISAYLFNVGTPAEAFVVLGVFAAAALRALPTLTRVSSNIATLRTGQPGLRIFLAAADELRSVGAHDEQPRDHTRYLGDIVIDGVEFRYPDSSDPVLDRVSLRIPQNSTMAFVGSSGAGKSTLIDLVLGLLEPTRGTIECGGRPIADDRAAWYAGLGVVPQDVFLFNDTIAMNVAFEVDADRVDLDRVDEALAMAQLDGIVAAMPNGVDTVVGERGVRLSGGQRQRLGIARALYRRPSVLVLDEATSALDNETERQISETLAKLGGTMTILIVAHRLSTVRHADTLVFLKDGRIEAQGGFEDVRSSNDEFARLVELGRLD